MRHRALLSAALGVALARPCSAQSPSELFQQALLQERSAGKLDSAIALYRRVALQAGSNRPLAARALLRLGGAYELLGRTEAQVAYGRLVRDYPDQGDAVRQARARIVALRVASAGTRPAPSTVPETRRVWAGPGQAGESPPLPGGDLFAYVDPATSRVAIHDFATGRDRRLVLRDSTDSPGSRAQNPLISPDRKQVAYGWFVGSANSDGHHELRIVPVAGGRPRTIPLAGVQFLKIHAWSPDGKQIVAVVSRGGSGTSFDPWTLALIDLADGRVHRLRPFPAADCVHAEMSPDGKWIAFDVSANDEVGKPSEIHVIASDGTREHAVIEHPAWDWSPFWTPDGRGLVFMSDRTGGWSAWLVGLDDGVVTREPRLVKADMGGNDPIGFARDGSFLFRPIGLNAIEILTLDPETGVAVELPFTPSQVLIGNHIQPDWSPDGKSLAFISVRGNGKNVPGSRVLETVDLSTGQRSEFKFPFDFLYFPRWSPDGRAILFAAADTRRPPGVYVVDVTTGALRLVVPTQYPVATSATWSANGASIFFVTFPDSVHPAIWRHDLSDSSQRVIYQSTERWILSVAPSKDGRFLAFSEGERIPRLLLLSLSDGAMRELPIARSVGDTIARSYGMLNWTPDGELLAIKPRVRSDVIIELWRIPTDGRPPRKLHEAARLLNTRLSPDGRRIAYSMSTSDPRVLSVWAIRNFLPPTR